MVILKDLSVIIVQSDMSQKVFVCQLLTLFLTLSQMTNFRLFQIEGVLQKTLLNLMKISESSPNE